MNAWRKLKRAWRDEMNAADRTRVVFGFSFPLGAFLHFGWLGVHGLLYHGAAPAWAVTFWYSLCAVDFVVAWLMLTHPRIGIALGCAVMAFSLWVNWSFFPTFQLHFNYVLIGLTSFGVALAACAPWMWMRARWRWV